MGRGRRKLDEVESTKWEEEKGEEKRLEEEEGG
jgi:hypothetical protein